MDQTHIPTSANELEQEDFSRIERIWNERALQMAKVNTNSENQDAQMTVLLMRLGRELLGLDVKCVFDIRAREAVTRVPRVPNWVAGVTNLRGNILSVIDLCKYFGLPSTRDDQPGMHVIVQAGESDPRAQRDAMEIIFLVDDVLGVESLPVRQNAADGGMIHRLPPEYILFIGERRGEARVDSLAQQHVVVLNVENVLADPRLIIHDEVA
jgi:purine-binding chemotaxis protein CheW